MRYSSESSQNEMEGSGRGNCVDPEAIEERGVTTGGSDFKINHRHTDVTENHECRRLTGSEAQTETNSDDINNNKLNPNTQRNTMSCEFTQNTPSVSCGFGKKYFAKHGYDKKCTFSLPVICESGFYYLWNILWKIQPKQQKHQPQKTTEKTARQELHYFSKKLQIVFQKTIIGANQKFRN